MTGGTDSVGGWFVAIASGATLWTALLLELGLDSMRKLFEVLQDGHAQQHRIVDVLGKLVDELHAKSLIGIPGSALVDEDKRERLDEHID